MARVIGFLGNGRPDGGYTITVLKEALKGAESVSGVQTELIYLTHYKFGSCVSSYNCIRDPNHRCTLADDMGLKGEGKLWKIQEGANGFIFGSPVHHWNVDALTHLFIERLYPYTWSGEIKGLPVATINVASNQGFQDWANKVLCELMFALDLKYIGGLPVHAAYMDEALPKARYLGVKLGEAAIIDEREGRHVPTDEEAWLNYQNTAWKVYPHYLENLTMGTGNPRFSVIRRSLSNGTFKNKEAIDLLEKADKEFEDFSRFHSLNDERNAIRSLVKASTYWTHATWKEFLEEQKIKVKQPGAYRPFEENEIEPLI